MAFKLTKGKKNPKKHTQKTSHSNPRMAKGRAYSNSTLGWGDGIEKMENTSLRKVLR